MGRKYPEYPRARRPVDEGGRIRETSLLSDVYRFQISLRYLF